MFQQPQPSYSQYGGQPQQQQQGFNTSQPFYQSATTPSRTSQLYQSQSNSTAARTPDQQKDAMNTTPIQTTYIPGYLIASQSGRGPPASVWQSPSAKETTPTKEDENPFAREAPIFRDSRAASTSFKPSTPYSTRSGVHLAKPSPRTPGERQTPYSPEYTRNSPPSDEDSVPQVSLSDIMPLPRRSRGTPTPDESSHSLVSSDLSSSSLTKAVKLVIFGYPAHLTTRMIKDFTSFGKDQVVLQEEGPEGSNYFVVGYKDPVLAARLYRRNGELIDGIYRIGIAYQDPRQQADPYNISSSPAPDASLLAAANNAPLGSGNVSLGPGHHLRTTASNVSLIKKSALLPDPPKKSTAEWIASFFATPAPAQDPAKLLPPPPGSAAPGAVVGGAQTASASWGITPVLNKVSELVFGW